MEGAKKSVFERADCPCSALAVNCLQLGCCVHDASIVDFGVNNANWMGRLCRVNPDMKLRDLVIPGTHDSASYTINKLLPFSAVGLTQNLTITEQLNRGIRYLDLRIGGDGDADDGVVVHHGCLRDGIFTNILQDICTFLLGHPSEFLFIEVVQEFGKDFTPAQKKHALDTIQRTFDAMIYTTNNCSHLLNELSLHDLMNLNKQVCVLIHPRIQNFELEGVIYDQQHINETYGFFNSHQWMRNHWHNTRDIDMLLQWNLEEVQKYGTNRDIILNNQFVLTPGVGGPKDMLHLLVGLASLRPVSFASKLYRQDVMDSFFRSSAEQPWHLVTMDFVDLAPALICFMIGLNFPSRLTIFKASAGPGTAESPQKDVTEKIQSFVRRSKVLYLADIAADLGLEYTEGRLTLAYQISNDTPNLLDITFDETTEIIVGEYSHNEGLFVHLDGETTAGVFYKGKVIAHKELDPMADKQGCIKYEVNDGIFNFSLVK